MVEAFLFDYDGVVTQGVPDGTLAGRLADNVGVKQETATAWIDDIWLPLIKGVISEADAFNHFEERLGGPIAPEQRDVWYRWSELQPLPEMLALLKRLRAKGYPLGVLSNATASTKNEVREHGGYDMFDFVIISSEVGCKKPDDDIFYVALRQLPGVEPENVVFLDDREAATKAAARLGMQTIWVKDHAEAIRQIEELI